MMGGVSGCDGNPFGFLKYSYKLHSTIVRKSTHYHQKLPL